MHITQTLTFQKEILHLVLRKPIFSQRFYKLVAQDKDLKEMKFKFFSNKYISHVANCFYVKAMSEHVTTMSKGILENEISRMDTTPEEKQRMVAMLNEVWDMHIPDFNLHDREIINYLKVIKTSHFVKTNINLFEKGFEGALGYESKVHEYIGSLSKLSARTNTKVDMDDLLKVIDEYADSSNTNLPFGLAELDEELNGGGQFGGFGRKELSIIISGVNDGKSVTLISMNCHNVRLGNRVRHINLEGKRLQPAMRHIANLAKIDYKKLIRVRDKRALNPDLPLDKYFSSDEMKRIAEAEKTVKNLEIYHEISNSTIESIEALARELYNDKEYDMLVIDYLQLVTTSMPFLKRDEALGYIGRRLEILASELNISVVSPMQVNRSGLNELRLDAKSGMKYATYTMDMIGESKKIADTAATIIAYSRTQEERKAGRGRYSIIKQREGMVGKQIGIVSNFSHLNMFEGERYYIGNGEETETSKNKFAQMTDAFSNIDPAANKAGIGNIKMAYTQLEVMYELLDNAESIIKADFKTLPEKSLTPEFVELLKKNSGSPEDFREFVNQKIDELVSTYRSDLKKANDEKNISYITAMGREKLDNGKTLGSLVLDLKDKIGPFLE